MPKILVFLYTTYKRINPFSICYIINPKLHIKKLFREQVEIFLRPKFHQNSINSIENVIRNKDTCVISLIIFMRVKKTK